MRSFISSSDRASADRPAIAASRNLIILTVLFLVALELAFRLGLPRVSRMERQLEEEYHGALESVRGPSSPERVVVMGNSLLDAGVRFEEVRRALAPGIDARRLMVLGSVYYDWYYGLQRLFDEGSRPDLVVLVLSPSQFVSSQYCGDYFAFHLMKTEDLLSVARDLKLSNTQTSSLAFANLSAYCGLRTQVRKLLSRLIFPDLPRLTALMTVHPHPNLTEESVRSTSLPRFRALRELAERYGAKFVLVVPPAGGSENGGPLITAIQRAGISAGVPVLSPIAPESVPADHFSDGFHLNEQGAALFTPRFLESIRQEIGRMDEGSPIHEHLAPESKANGDGVVVRSGASPPHGVARPGARHGWAPRHNNLLNSLRIR